MPSVQTFRRHTTNLSKTCVQAATLWVTSAEMSHFVSTGLATAHTNRWKYRLLFPTALHKFCMQFYSAKIHQITDHRPGFSPLSTALIIRTKWVLKENQLVGQGG